MKTSARQKLTPPGALADLRKTYRQAGRVVVLCHGCFDIVHPGHLRYLQFARQRGDVLVVSITGDDAIEKSDGTRPYVPQELRAEALAALEIVDHVTVVDHATAEPVIRAIEPDVYIKGKEYEHAADPRFIAEKQLVESLGGRVIFSSGEVVFSSTALLEQVGPGLDEPGIDDLHRLATCCRRWDIDGAGLRRSVQSFAGLRIAVVGDALLDRYVFCDAKEVAGEAPVMSVRPLDEKVYLGGAAVVAAHLKGLGAEPHLITTVAQDADTDDLLARLDQLGIGSTALATRERLPTKLRYLVETQKLLKVDSAYPQPLDSTAQKRAVERLLDDADAWDGVVFCDFGYGAVTQTLLEATLPVLRQRVGTITGDVSGARRSMLALHTADLLTPSERELRSVMGDFEQSLPTLGGRLMRQLKLANLAVTMGRRGCVMFRPREEDPRQWFTGRLRSDYLPSLARREVDPMGAGDAFLAGATLMLCAGAKLPQAGYLGSVAAALSVEQLGNPILSRERLLGMVACRPELAGSRRAETA